MMPQRATFKQQTIGGRIGLPGRQPYRPSFPKILCSDSYLTNQVTLEDALSHRTGIPDHEKSYGPSTATVRDTVRSLRHFSDTAAIRTKFMYNNMMYVAITHAIERVAESSLGHV